MSKIVIGTANGKNAGFDLPELLKTRLLIQADSGGGKSWLIRVLAEQLFGKVQTIIIDPEGEFATLREKFDYVLVGKGGETPADPRSAVLVAQRLMELKASAVCDLYELKHLPRHQWVKLFLDALIELPKQLWHPAVVIVDEAHVFCPEKGKGDSEASQSMIDLCTRGRKRGFCAVFATQRLGTLNKDASSNLQNRLIGPTFEDINRKRAAEVLGILKGSDEREFFRNIQLLSPGKFYALGRAISRERILIQIGKVQTSHPEMGVGKHSAEAPPPTAKIRALLPKLEDLPKEAEDRARSEADFRREIRDLKQRLTVAEKLVGKPVTKEVAKADPLQARVIRDQDQVIRQFRSLLGDAMKIIAKINAVGFDGANVNAEEVSAALKKAADEVGRMARQKLEGRALEFERLKTEMNRLMARLNSQLSKEEIKLSVDVVKNEPATVRHSIPLPATRQTRQPTAISEFNGDITGVQQNILNQLAELEALGIKTPERSQLALMANYTNWRSGGFSEPLGRLIQNGLAFAPAPGRVALTEEGKAKAAAVDSPLSAAELHERLCRKLGGPEEKLLREIIAVYPEQITKEDLGARLNYTNIRSGGFSEPLGRLRSLGIVEYPQSGQVKAAGWLFLEGAA